MSDKRKMVFKTVPCQLVIKRTEKAMLCLLKEGDEMWFPLSVLATQDSKLEEGAENFDLHVHDWFAEKEGL